jgi:hypothetical protein
MSIFGVITTIAYIGIIAAIRWESFPELATMPLNEFGDFFAGVLGPLMLFWLILGYIQQQKELRQNTAALELQADELKNSVEQHKEIVKATKEQVQADLKALEMKQIRALREASPSFSIVSFCWSSRHGEKINYEIGINNVGRAASDVSFSTDPEIKQINRDNVVRYFETGQIHTLKWDTETNGGAPNQLKLIINCQDANTRPYTKMFDFVLVEEEYRLSSVA